MKERYSCKACKYKFSRSMEPPLCPFCGKPTVTVDTSPSADRLIREVERMHTSQD